MELRSGAHRARSVAPHRGDLAHQLGQPAAARPASTGDQLAQRRGGRHHITHAALDIDAALDVVLAQARRRRPRPGGLARVLSRATKRTRASGTAKTGHRAGSIAPVPAIPGACFHHRQQRIHDFLSPEYERTRRLYRKSSCNSNASLAVIQWPACLRPCNNARTALYAVAAHRPSMPPANHFPQHAGLAHPHGCADRHRPLLHRHVPAGVSVDRRRAWASNAAKSNVPWRHT